MTTAERPLADLRRDQRTGHGTGRRPIGTPDPAFAHALSPAAAAPTRVAVTIPSIRNSGASPYRPASASKAASTRHLYTQR